MKNYKNMWSRSLVVRTLDSQSGNSGPNPGGTTTFKIMVPSTNWLSHGAFNPEIVGPSPAGTIYFDIKAGYPVQGK